MLRYYGVDDIEPGEFSFLRDSLGGNFAIVELSTDVNAWKTTLEEAEKDEIDIVIWPLGNGHQWTPWAWDGSSWDISQGLDAMNYAETYVNSGGDNLVAVVMSHEPFYNHGDPFTASEMKLLYSALKNVAPHVKLFVYMNDMAYYNKRPNTIIEDGIMDIAGIWKHVFGGAEGTYEDAFKEIDDDYALIQAKGLNLQLFFALQTFAIAGTDYKMPSAAEMLDFTTQVLEKKKLDGLFYYPWDRVATSYTSYLSKDRYDSIGADRWSVVSQLSAYLPATGIQEDGAKTPPFSLSQNYPNPFSPETKIEFKVSDPGPYTIEVFNLLGQQVATLFDKDIPPGSYTVDFNANCLSSGMYIYTLRNNTSIITKTMIIKQE
ncbi:T9SS type A sorting domain-containing protein [Bacteroidota bacterium]